MVQAAVQTDAASQSTAEAHQVPPGPDVPQDDAPNAEESHVFPGSGGAGANTAADGADGTGPGADDAAESGAATAAPQDGVEVKSPALPEAIQGSNLLVDERKAVSGVDAAITPISPSVHEQQISSASRAQQAHQPISDSRDALLDVDGLDSISSSPPSCLVTSRRDAGQELQTDSDNNSPQDATLGELEDVAAAAASQLAAESSAAEAAGQATAAYTPGSPAADLPMSSAASPDVLSALGSVGSDTSLSGLSLGADSMEEPELDQLSLGGLDDAASAPPDGFQITGVPAKATNASPADESLDLISDPSDVQAEGLSDSEVDFDSAGELSEPQLASALQPPSAVELQPAAAVEPQPPARIKVRVGHDTSAEAAATAAEPGPDNRDASDDPETEAQPFSARAMSNEVGATDALHGGGEWPWETAVAAAEAAEAELLQGRAPASKMRSEDDFGITH